MSYQVLARKWRPSNFAQVAGQTHVLKSLINALDNQRLHHAYLFTGTRGVGKTTLARILAKCLNCETGISSTPCETCDSCREISEGRFIDLIEVDAASRTKVEDTRDLLENVQYSPSRGRFKVYLIDEVHMLSTHSFNALLKTLEEPPPHVKFLFATTDPQKLPITVLSRCLQFNLKNLSPGTITEYLIDILRQEKIDSEEAALWQIAAAAGGSMRDALTLADQAISYCQGKISVEGVVEMLGIPEQQKVFRLLEEMSSGDVKRVFALMDTLSDQTPDYGQTLDSFMSVLHRVAMAQVLPEAIDNSMGDKQVIQNLAGQLTAEDVQLYYQLGIKGREDLRFASDARAAFEMLLLRMMVFSPNYVAVTAAPTTDNTSQSDSQSAESDEKKKTESPDDLARDRATSTLAGSPEIATASAPSSRSRATTEPASSNPAVPNPATRELPTQRPPAETAHQTASAAEKSGTRVMPSAKPASDSASSDNLTELETLTHVRWLEVYKALGIGGIVGNVLANSQLESVNGKALHFILDKSQSAVFSEEIQPKVSQALAEYFGVSVSATIQIGEVSAETPAMLSQRLKQERHLEMVDEFEHDENVQELLKHFSGTLAKETIAPIKLENGND